MFERFTANARQCVVESQAAARESQQAYIDSPHVLLGILRADESAGAQALADAGFSVDTLTKAVEEKLPPSGEPATGTVPFTPEAKRLIEYGLREALANGHNWIGSAHLVLACLRTDLFVAVAPFVADRADAIRERAKEALTRSGRDDSATAAAPPPEPATASRKGPPRTVRDTDRAPSDREETLREAVDEAQDAGHQESVPTHRDRPSKVDQLRRVELAEVLAERMRRVSGEDTESPGTWRPRGGEAILVHIHAPWGAGKSTLLGFLRRELEAPRDVRLANWIVVEFSAWQHQRVAPPWWWLLAAIRREGARALWRRSRPRAAVFVLRDLRWRAWNARSAVLVAMLAAGLAIASWRTGLFGLPDQSLTGIKAGAVALSAVSALAATVFGLARNVGRWVTFGAAPPGHRLLQRAQDPMRASQRRFRFLVDRLQDPVAVLIDDLDRCDAEYVVELLEGIQTLFLDRPVAYVLAGDRDWLCKSYEAVYEKFKGAAGEQGRPLGYLFLEKTFQISLEIPRMSEDIRAAYWRDLVHGNAAGPDHDASGDADEAATRLFRGLRSEAQIDAALSAPVSSAAEAEARRRAAVRRLSSPEMERTLEHALEPFSHLLENNPRAMKRLVNAYGVERALQTRSGVSTDRETRIQSVLWIILRLRWPLLGDWLVRCPADIELLLSDGMPTTRVPVTLAEVFSNADARAVARGEGLDTQLTESAVRRFSGTGSMGSSVGA